MSNEVNETEKPKKKKKSKVGRLLRAHENIVDFKILSCDNRRNAVIEFYYNDCKYTKTLKYENIVRTVNRFAVSNDGEFIEIEDTSRKTMKTPDAAHLNKRKSDLLLYTDEVKSKLVDYVKANQSDKYAAFLYYAINTEELSVAAKSNKELYADKTESLSELINISTELNYKLHVVKDDDLTWKFKLLIIVLDDGTDLAYHFKDIKMDFTDDFEWDGAPINFTEYLIEKIKEMLEIV